MSVKFTFKAIGTSWAIDIPGPRVKEVEIFELIKNKVDSFEGVHSRFLEDSLVLKISKKIGIYKFPENSELMFSLYRELYDITGGLMTPLIGQVLSDAGYDSEYSLLPKKEISKAKKWDDVMHYSNFVLETKDLIQLDFGALGKGCLIDIVAKTLIENGVSDYLINAGGDIAYKTTDKNKKLKVGLENPQNTSEVLGVAQIINQSICGSAGNRRAWEGYHHIINPETKESPKHILALWVVADTTILADALATALFFVEPEKLSVKYKFEYAIINKDQSLKVSENFPGNFFTQVL